jgi:hypothetical protein
MSVPAPRKSRRKVVALLAAAELIAAVIARLRGYGVGGNTVVRCRQGHLFTTIWIPGVSVKSLRLGWWRLQRCPVGSHWTIVVPVRTADLSWWERRGAEKQRDIRLP